MTEEQALHGKLLADMLLTERRQQRRQGSGPSPVIIPGAEQPRRPRERAPLWRDPVRGAAARCRTA